MPWNSTWPLGTTSVKANRPTGQENTTYIETTMGNSIVGTNTNTTRDHFWNVGADEDGRHRFVQSPAFTVGGNPDDPVIGSGMDGVRYLKLTNGTVQGFYRNVEGIYEYIPTFLSGTHVVTASFTNMVTVPDNVYGEIFMYTTALGRNSGQSGFFKATSGVCEAWAYGMRIQGDTDALYNVQFGNGSNASGLNIRVIRDQASAGLTWNYRITYRAV